MRPFFLFAPGAGAPSSHPWMQDWKTRLEEVGDVAAFDYPYMRDGRKRPDPLPQLVGAHRQALASLRTGTPEVTILIGKSMGGRIGCHLALDEKVDGLICLGYPLCAMGDRTNSATKFCRRCRLPSCLCKAAGIRFALWIYWRKCAVK